MKVIEKRSGTWSPELTTAEQATLYTIALDTLTWCVGHPRGEYSFDRHALTDALHTPRATFVTLHKNGRLRGCIGSLQPEAPLYRSVHENAIRAALHDSRFHPVDERERPLLYVDVSILSPIVPIPDPSGFRLGEHGIILKKGYHQSVYLPEVAPEQGWTVEQTLRSLSEKAGMDPDAWRSGTTFQVFSSVVLSADKPQ